MADASGGPTAALRDLLHRPARLGLVLNVALLASWYGAVYLPMQRSIGRDQGRVDAERERLALAREVEHLRGQAALLDGRLPDPRSGDAWLPFLMGGVRRFPIKLVSLEPRPSIDVGPYRAAVHRVVVEGSYPELERFLRWLEGEPRLVRVDSIQIATKAVGGPGAAPGATTNEMQLLVLGVEG